MLSWMSCVRISFYLCKYYFVFLFLTFFCRCLTVHYNAELDYLCQNFVLSLQILFHILILDFLQVLDSSQKLLPRDELRKQFEQEGKNLPSIVVAKKLSPLNDGFQ
jgi:hypothetical protein